jgi:hypothetical protein
MTDKKQAPKAPKASKATKAPKVAAPKLHFKISGFEGCPYFEQAYLSLQNLKNNVDSKIVSKGDSKSRNIIISVHKIQRVDWPKHLEQRCSEIIVSHKPNALLHKSSPFISCNNKFIGGYDKLLIELQKSKAFTQF